jgi:DNA-binding transcriptional regulator YhcF (GntR family)
MNRIWISRHGSIPVREQLSAQLLFGILSQRIEPSERLPSVRDLARRLKLHPNTVSAAYQDLAARGWVKRKAGSGVFVCDIQNHSKGEDIDTLVGAWIEEGLSRGFSFEALSAAFGKARKRLGAQVEPRSLLVVHPDRNLACILAAEIQEAVGCRVPYAGLEDARVPEFEAFMLLTTTSGAGAVAQLRPEGHRLIALKSIEEVLHGLGRPASPVLIGIVSRSETILKWASLLIPVFGLAGSDLIQRNPEQPNWRHGLGACDLVVADIVAARELSKSMRPIVLRLVADSFLQEARQLVTAEKV